MDQVNETTLKSLHQAGKEIAAIFSGSLAEQDKSRIISQLLILMRHASSEDSAMSAKLMILGALAAVGREVGNEP